MSVLVCVRVCACVCSVCGCPFAWIDIKASDGLSGDQCGKEGCVGVCSCACVNARQPSTDAAANTDADGAPHPHARTRRACASMHVHTHQALNVAQAVFLYCLDRIDNDDPKPGLADEASASTAQHEMSWRSRLVPALLYLAVRGVARRGATWRGVAWRGVM